MIKKIFFILGPSVVIVGVIVFLLLGRADIDFTVEARPSEVLLRAKNQFEQVVQFPMYVKFRNKGDFPIELSVYELNAAGKPQERWRKTYELGDEGTLHAQYHFLVTRTSHPLAVYRYLVRLDLLKDGEPERITERQLTLKIREG